MSLPSISRAWWVSGFFLSACIGLGGYLYLETSRPTVASLPAQNEDEECYPSMPGAQTTYLWDIEHHGNLLSQQGFKAIARAIREQDEKGLLALLGPDFHGQIPDQPQERKNKTDVVDVVRRTAGEASLRSMDRRQFAAELCALRQVFDKPPDVKLSLMGLSPVKRDAPDDAWQGTCLLRMWGSWKDGKPAEVAAYLKYRIRKPSEENLAAGGWLLDCTFTQTQIGKSERFLFREVAAARGLHPERFQDNWKNPERWVVNTGGVYVFDFNRDGILDVLVSDPNGVFLYQGLPEGKFKDVTAEMGLIPDNLYPPALSNAVIVADLDGDGWDDLVLGRSSIYRNEGGKRFVNVSGRCNLRLPPDSVGAAVGDYDRDGKLDLYVFRASAGKAGSWIDGKGGVGRGNVLYRNKGNWQFENVTAATGTSGDDRSTFSAAWFDADGDGWPDLYVTNEFGNGVLYHNKGDGTFEPRSLGVGPTDFGSMGLAVGDIDNDGRPDLYVGAMYSKAGSRVIGNMWPNSYSEELMAKMRTFVVGSRLHRNLGGLKFEEVGTKWQVHDAGWAYAPAMADLDNDGWLDLYGTAGHISRDRKKPDG